MKNKFKNCIKMIFALLAVILFCDTATVKASTTEIYALMIEYGEYASEFAGIL